jgi:hypothetical protein
MDDRLGAIMLDDPYTSQTQAPLALVGYETPSTFHFKLVESLLTIRRFILSYLYLPRPSFIAVHEVSDEADATTGRYHLTPYETLPTM